MTLPGRDPGLTGGETAHEAIVGAGGREAPRGGGVEWKAGTPRRGRRPAWLTRSGGDFPQPRGYGLLVTPRLPSPCGARLGGSDGVRLGWPREALGGGHRGRGRARLLIPRRGNRHCRQTYPSRARLSTPLGPTR